MRGAELYRRFTPKDNANARTLFEQAIALDPKFARAYANLAATHRQEYYGRWSPDPQSSENLAYRMVEKAVELADNEREPKPSLPFALEQRGWLALYSRKYGDGHGGGGAGGPTQSQLRGWLYLVGASPCLFGATGRSTFKNWMKLASTIRNFRISYDYIRGQANFVSGVQSPRAATPARNILKRPGKTFRRLSAKTTIIGRPALTSWLSSQSLVDLDEAKKSDEYILAER